MTFALTPEVYTPMQVSVDQYNMKKRDGSNNYKFFLCVLCGVHTSAHIS